MHALAQAILRGSRGGCRSVSTRSDLEQQHAHIRGVLSQLTAEQRVLVDAMVLHDASRVVGAADSLLTVFVSEWRGLQEDMPAVVRVLAAPKVANSMLDTDPLLRVAALTARHDNGMDPTAMAKLFSEDAPLLRDHGVAV